MCRYTNGVLIAPIQTAAMKHAISTSQTPFALLRPLSGIPVLVRVLLAGSQQVNITKPSNVSFCDSPRAKAGSYKSLYVFVYPLS